MKLNDESFAACKLLSTEARLVVIVFATREDYIMEDKMSWYRIRLHVMKTSSAFMHNNY